MYKIKRTTTHSHRSGQRIRFDEKNLLQTCRTENKDYGFMPIECVQNPVDVALLRLKLREAIQRASQGQPSAESTNIPMNITVIQSLEECAKPKFVRFVERRKKFYAAEFAIAKQHRMSQLTHEAGASIPSGHVLVKYPLKHASETYL